MIWNKKYESMQPDEMRNLQRIRLQEVLRSVYEKVPFYRQNMTMAGVRPDAVKTLKDIQQLPFTTKQDMRDNYPYGAVGFSDERDCACACVKRYHRKTDGCCIYAQRPRCMGRSACADIGGRRPAQRFGFSGIRQLWPVYRRTGHALRRRKNRRSSGACFRRKLESTGDADARFWHDGDGHHAFLCIASGGSNARHGHKTRRYSPGVRILRRRGMVGQDA